MWVCCCRAGVECVCEVCDILRIVVCRALSVGVAIVIMVSVLMVP